MASTTAAAFPGTTVSAVPNDNDGHEEVGILHLVDWRAWALAPDDRWHSRLASSLADGDGPPMSCFLPAGFGKEVV